MAWNAADQIDGDDLVPFLDREFLDRRDVLDAGVVDQDVAGAELALRRLDHGGDLGGLGHVGARVDRLDAELLLDAGALLLDGVGRAEAVDQDVGAVLGERAGDAEADAGGGAGDHRVFAFKHLKYLLNREWQRGNARRPGRRSDLANLLLHCSIGQGAPSLFCATRRTGYNRPATPYGPYVATGLPRPRSRSRALRRRRAEARRGVVRAAGAAADADPPPGAGAAAGEPQAARRLRDHGPRRRER